MSSSIQLPKYSYDPRLPCRSYSRARTTRRRPPLLAFLRRLVRTFCSFLSVIFVPRPPKTSLNLVVVGVATLPPQDMAAKRTGRSFLDLGRPLWSLLEAVRPSLGSVGLVFFAATVVWHKTFTYLFVYPTFRLLFGTLYPAYASYKAVKTKNVREYVSTNMLLEFSQCE